MAPENLQCPQCRVTLRNSAGVQPGETVECPKCQTQFAVPDESGAVTGTPPPPRTVEEQYSDAPTPSRRPRVADEPDEDYPRRRRYLHDDDADDEPPPISNEYHIDFGRWFDCAKAHWSAVLGPMIGFILLVGVINWAANLPASIANQVIVSSASGGPKSPPPIGLILAGLAGTQIWALLVNFLLTVPLAAGTYFVLLRQLDGRRWTFADFFSGFKKWGTLAALGAMSAALNLLIFVPVGLIIAGFANQYQELIGAGAGALLLAFPILIFLAVRCFAFTQLLVFDRNLGAIEAIKANWELTRGHFWGVFGAILLIGIISIAGILGCIIGVLFTVPLGALTLTAGYLFIAGRREPLPAP
jgi:hypothetical protein